MTSSQAPSALSSEMLTRIYRDMVRSRALDSKLRELSGRKKLVLNWHSGEGQEGLCATYSQLRADDVCGYTHRGCYVWVCRGMDLGPVVAELAGKATGTSKGKGGSHVAGWKYGVYGRSGMQGGHFPVITGSAEAAKMLGSDRVAVCSFGDGAATSGNLHEAAAHAAVRKLAVIFHCENNGFNMSVRAEASWAQPDIAKLAIGYGMPYAIVDSNDAMGLAKAAQEAIARGRSGGGPTFLELKTYRMHGHQENDRELSGYRTRAEVDAWRAKDPINRMRNTLLEMKGLTPGDVQRIGAEAAQEIQRAADFAEQSPLPDPKDAWSDVYVEA
jgi:TPP-dependent pyruvate/acetoin dehydrogenase alpha subunit